MLRKLFALHIYFCSLVLNSKAQELFPNSEPASNVPKGVLRIGLANEAFQEYSQFRLWQGYSFIYGITGNLSLEQTLSFSNHHALTLPEDFIYYNPSIKGLQTTGYIFGQSHPFWFENYLVKLKYRFLCLDGDHRHFRMATYLQLAGGDEPHPEAEPNLYGDNSGTGWG